MLPETEGGLLPSPDLFLFQIVPNGSSGPFNRQSVKKLRHNSGIHFIEYIPVCSIGTLDYQYQNHKLRMLALKYFSMPAYSWKNIDLILSAISAALLSIFDYSDWTNT